MAGAALLATLLLSLIHGAHRGGSASVSRREVVEFPDAEGTRPIPEKFRSKVRGAQSCGREELGNEGSGAREGDVAAEWGGKGRGGGSEARPGHRRRQRRGWRAAKGRVLRWWEWERDRDASPSGPGHMFVPSCTLARDSRLACFVAAHLPPNPPPTPASARTLPPSPPLSPLPPAQVIVAFMSSNKHIVGWARASRSWRFGVPAVLTTADPVEQQYIDEGKLHNETYVHWRTDKVPQRALFKYLWALTPTLAFEQHPDAEWLLYGDDDTVFFIDTAYRVLQNFDPAYPHILNDHIWLHPNHIGPRVNMRHGDPISGRCVPCGTYASASLLNVSDAGNTTAYAASIAAAYAGNGTAIADGLLAAFANNRTAKAGVLAAIKSSEIGGGKGSLLDPIPQTRGYNVWRPPEACPVCTWEMVEASDPERPYMNLTRWEIEKWNVIATDPTMHGGGGMVLSRGLLRQLDRRFMVDKCFFSNATRFLPGGDSLLSRCVFWTGIAPTETGSFIRNQLYQAFGPIDYQSKGFLDDAYAYTRTSETCCDVECQYRLENTMAVHLRTAHFVTPEFGQRTADMLGRMREAYVRAREWAADATHVRKPSSTGWDASPLFQCK